MTKPAILPDYVKGQIYLISNTINEKKYVGQVKTHMWNKKSGSFRAYGYQYRFKSHLSNTLNFDKYGRCRALNSAMKAHGRENFSVRLLIECPVDQLDELETNYIKEYNSLAPNGYNLETGGNAQKWLSTETKERQAASKKRFYQTEEGKKFIERQRQVFFRIRDAAKLRKLKEAIGNNSVFCAIAHKDPFKPQINLEFHVLLSPERYSTHFSFGKSYTECTPELMERVEKLAKEITPRFRFTQ